MRRAQTQASRVTIVTVLALCFSLISARTIHVELNGQDVNSCGSTGTPCRSIDFAIIHAQDQLDSIVVGPGRFRPQYASGIQYNKRVPISGQSTTVIACDNNRGFIISDCPDCSIETMTFEGCHTFQDGGAAIRVFNTNLRLRHISFIRNTVDVPVGDTHPSRGGAIFGFSGAHLDISDVLFLNNSASHGSAIYLDESSTAKIKRSQFVTNFAHRNPSYTGATYGAVYVATHAELHCDQCTMTNNVADRGAAISVVEDAKAFIVNSHFENNLALFYGGAVLVENSAFVNATDTYFLNNRAALQGTDYTCKNPDQCAAGGAFVIQRDTNVINIDQGRGYFHNVTFIGNQAHTGSIGLADSSYLAMVGCTGHSNVATRGTITVDKGWLAITGSAFTDNRAETGSILEVRAGTHIAKVTQTQLKRNTATANGGILVNGLTATEFDNCVFEANSAHSFPVFETNAGSIVFQSCVFSSNHATSEGGVGSIRLSSEGTFKSCHFDGNTAGASSGAVTIDKRSAATFSEVSFTGNRATRFGGAIVSDSSSTFACSTCAFRQNSAIVGGAIYFSTDDTEPNFDSSKCASFFGPGTAFENNRAGEYGAAVFWSMAVPLCPNVCHGNCTFTNNTDINSVETVQSAIHHFNVLSNDTVYPGVPFTLKLEPVDVEGNTVTAIVDETGQPADIRLTVQNGLVNTTVLSTVSSGVVTFQNVVVKGDLGAYSIIATVSDAPEGMQALAQHFSVSECPTNYQYDQTYQGCRFVIPVVNDSYGKSRRDLLFAVGFLLMSLTTVVTIVVLKNASKPVILRAQPAFCKTVLAGLNLSILSVLITYQYPPHKLQCMVRPWLWHISYALIFLPLLCKLLLVDRNWMHTRHPLNSTNLRLKQYAGSYTVATLVCLTLFTIVSSPHADTVDSYEGTGDQAIKHQLEECHLQGFNYVFFAVEAIIVLAGCVLSLRTSHIRTMYNERQHVSFVFYSSALLSIASVVLITMNKHDHEEAYTVENAGILAMAFIKLVTLFGPKMYRLTSWYSGVEYETQASEIALQIDPKPTTIQGVMRVSMANNGNDLKVLSPYISDSEGTDDEYSDAEIEDDIDGMEKAIAFERVKSARNVEVMTDNDDEMVEEEIAKLKRRQRPSRGHISRPSDMSSMMAPSDHELSMSGMSPMGSDDDEGEEELP